MKKTLLIDFDGVLNEYRGNFDANVIPEPKSGAKEFLENLSQKFEIKIFTTRDSSLVTKWFDENNLSQYVDKITNIKEPAWVIIDDRCIRFDGDFSQTLDEINNFQVYWKTK